MTTMTLAFAGNGETSKRNTFDLLDDYVSDHEETLRIILPISTDTTFDGGMETVLDWIEDRKLDFDVVYDPAVADREDEVIDWLIDEASKKVKTADVDLTVVDILGEYANTHLVLLWGEEGDPDLEEFLDRALKANIPVKDLCQGLDDLRFEDESPAEEPEAEPEPEEEEPEERPVRTRQRAVKAAPEPEPEPGEEESTEDPFGPSPVAPEEVFADLRGYISRNFESSREASLAMTTVDEAEMWLAKAAPKGVHAQQEADRADQEPEEAPKSRGRRRTDGSPAQPRSARDKAVMEIWDEDEEKWVKKGRGRAPKGAKTRMVDPVTGDVVSGDDD